MSDKDIRSALLTARANAKSRATLMIAGKKARNELLRDTPGYNPKLETFLRGGDVRHEVGSPERQQAFDQWGGAPERWYHGTSKDVDFPKFKIGRHGAWFARDPQEASKYAEQNDSQGHRYEDGKFVPTNTRSRVIPVHLKLGKSHTGPMPDNFLGAQNYKKAQSEWFDQLRAQGYDSWTPEGQNVAVILKDPTQIKSAIGNRGTYDPNEADIGKAAGGPVDDQLDKIGYRQDNPAVSRGSTEWLASKQRTAYSDPALLRGAVTGYFKDIVHIPVNMLDGVPGANKENPVPGTYKYDELMKDVKKDGWKPTPILVGVNHKGKPHILEGNHRVAVARALGQTHIPGDIRWWNGGEEVDGPWHPKRIAHRLTVAERTKRADGGAVDDDAPTPRPAFTISKRPEPDYIDGHLRLYHGGQGPLTHLGGQLPNAQGAWVTVPEGGTFGGFFAHTSPQSAVPLGTRNQLYSMDVPEESILTSFELEYELDHKKVTAAFNKALPYELNKGERDVVWRAVIGDDSESVIDDLIVALAEEDAGAASWAAQRMRGEVAKNLGYKAVEMKDEQGTSYLVLPGHRVTLIRNHPNGYAHGGIAEDPAKAIRSALLTARARVKRAEGGTADAPPDLNQQGFYSNAAQVAQSSLQQQAAPAQVRSTLLNKGVKPDELKWSGFDEKLGSKPVVTRDEVAQHFRDNMPDVQVTQLGGEGRNTSTKFSKETLPGGKNYREVLLHLPPHGAGVLDELTDKRNYQSSHWDEPNVLAHIRMSDRVGPNGEKVLHVEEIQSDWGQQGRESGFKDPALEEKLRIARDEATQRVEDACTELRKGMPDTDEVNRVLNPLLTAHKKAYQEHIAAQNGLPRGPYVDNTQKWTDLALKRVLHEAAHGGYDRIVFTPGEEQNKRYDLSRQVKNIQYYPDIGYLHATTHDDRGVEHNDVKPDDLAKHIGKEAADRILKQGMQRYEGRGKLGGEFYHELEGEGLKVGGEGMRKYYDEIVPSSLQKLAKKHDPQAQMQLHSHDLPTDEVYRTGSTKGHSLDVTPQMRDSIKAKGFNSFKRGGEIENDDPIAHWPWRPLEDVRNQLQLDEIPSHVHKFGEFMDETARRASTKGLTPRDLIKAYAITRSSIGRRALPVETLRASFPELPEGLIGSVRPEGAMGHWLHTKMGQQYLDAAEAGRVDEESIENAHTAMSRFGKDQTEPTALRWAAKNLPGQEGRVSELVARAHRGQSSPEEWRGEMRVPGVAASKAGFLASMLGRGDQPTLDARQIILHTGRPTKEAAPILGRKGAANAAVDRLADRQTSLGLKHDPAMSPFYQHLAHHTVWDKAAGEQTTHEDLMHAMRGAKAGGSIKGRAFSDHPLVHAMHAAGLPGLKRGGSAPDDDIVRGQLGSMSPQNLLRRASLSAGHPEQELLAALRQSGPREPEKQGISSLRSPELIERATATIVPNKRIAVTPPPRLSPADLYKRRALIIGGMSDRSGAGYDVSGADDVDFGENVSALGGVDYNRMPHSIKNQLGWASARQAISGLATPGKRAEEAGADQVMLTPKLMGLQALDQSHMMMKAASHLLRNAPVTAADAKAFNEHVRSLRPSMTKKKPNPEPHMPDFPGIKHPKLYEYLMNQSMPDRAQLIKAMDAGAWNKKGIPNPAAIRMAFTKPELMRAPTGTPGAFFATFDPNAPHHEDTDPRHPSYEIGLRGENVGGFDRVVPKELMFQKYFDAPENQGRRPADLMNAYMKKPVSQVANQQWLDRIMPTWEKTPQGWRRGGKTSSIVDRALKLTVKKHG